MKKLRWQILIVILALVAIGILLLSQKPVILPVIVPEVEPATGGVYTEGVVGALNRLNPLLDFNNPADRDI
jgi:peptide/nickel transport system substrate-binding protein